MFSSLDAYSVDEELSPGHLCDELDVVFAKNSCSDCFGFSCGKSSTYTHFGAP